jgi:hypothetical protein
MSSSEVSSVAEICRGRNSRTSNIGDRVSEVSSELRAGGAEGGLYVSSLKKPLDRLQNRRRQNSSEPGCVLVRVLSEKR